MKKFVAACAALMTLLLMLVPSAVRADDVTIIGMPTQPGAKMAKRSAATTELVCYNPATIAVTTAGSKKHLTWKSDGSNAADVDKDDNVQPFGSAGCPPASRAKLKYPAPGRP